MSQMAGADCATHRYMYVCPCLQAQLGLHHRRRAVQRNVAHALPHPRLSGVVDAHVAHHLLGALRVEVALRHLAAVREVHAVVPPQPRRRGCKLMLETKGLERDVLSTFQAVETNRFQRRVNLMCVQPDVYLT